MPGQLIITIDGPAGTGKSSVAHRLARRLGLEFLDTGAMYRSVALIALESGIEPSDGTALADELTRINLCFDWSQDPPRMMIDERDVSDRIRDGDVAEAVSIVASQPQVRAMLVDAQRRIADDHPRLVTEGRDQGSVVFPDACLRFYLDADPKVRAKRRADQLEALGADVNRTRVLHDILRRDELDSTRLDGPLTKPSGAIEVNTTSMTLDQVVDHLEQIVRDHVANRDLDTPKS